MIKRYSQLNIEEVARSKGYDIIAYHGSSVSFNVFKNQNPVHGQEFGSGFYFSTNREQAGNYGTVKKYFLSVKNPFRKDNIDFKQKRFTDVDVARSFFRDKLNIWQRDAGGYERFRPYIKIDEDKTDEDFFAPGEEIFPEETFIIFWVDSFQLEPSREQDAYISGDVIVVYEPEQIKIADTVTYSDNGKPIPMSERFNRNNPDVRY